MKFKVSFSCASAIAGIALLLSDSPSYAQQSAPYFEGKTITMVVGTAPAGRRDRIARHIANYLRKYVPGNPTIVVQNLAGGQGIPAQRKLHKGKPDGTLMGVVASSDMEAPFFGAPGADYNPRDYVWVGTVSTGKQRNVLYTHTQAGFKSIEDLLSREAKLGAIAVGHRGYLYGRLIAEILNLKVRWVIGYSTPELHVAIERGEVDGRVNDSASVMAERPDWFERREIVPHVAMTSPEDLPPVDHPLFAKVPSIMPFAKTEVHRDLIRKMNATDLLGAAVALPPGTPDRIRRILEEALMKAAKDPEFKRDWETVVGIRPYEGVFPAKETEKAVHLYTDWGPEVLEAYRRLGHEPPRR